MRPMKDTVSNGPQTATDDLKSKKESTSWQGLDGSLAVEAQEDINTLRGSNASNPIVAGEVVI